MPNEYPLAICRKSNLTGRIRNYTHTYNAYLYLYIYIYICVYINICRVLQCGHFIKFWKPLPSHREVNKLFLHKQGWWQSILVCFMSYVNVIIFFKTRLWISSQVAFLLFVLNHSVLMKHKLLRRNTFSVSLQMISVRS